jgi:hypothetical protein
MPCIPGPVKHQTGLHADVKRYQYFKPVRAWRDDAIACILPKDNHRKTDKLPKAACLGNAAIWHAL